MIGIMSEIQEIKFLNILNEKPPQNSPIQSFKFKFESDRDRH